MGDAPVTGGDNQGCSREPHAGSNPALATTLTVYLLFIIYYLLFIIYYLLFIIYGGTTNGR